MPTASTLVNVSWQLPPMRPSPGHRSRILVSDLVQRGGLSRPSSIPQGLSIARVLGPYTGRPSSNARATRWRIRSNSRRASQHLGAQLPFSRCSTLITWPVHLVHLTGGDPSQYRCRSIGHVPSSGPSRAITLPASAFGNTSNASYRSTRRRSSPTCTVIATWVREPRTVAVAP